MDEKQNLMIAEDGSIKDWKDTFSTFEKEYREAYFNIDNAIKMDEEGKTSDAIPLYEQGLNMIEKALEIPIYEPSKPDLDWEKTLAMIQKLRKTRKEIIIRIDNLKDKNIVPMAAELPPSYEDAVAEAGLQPESNGVKNNGNNFELPGSSKSHEPYISPSMVQDPILLANLHANDSVEKSDGGSSDLSEKINEMKLAKNEEILFHCDNVMLYFIAPDGRVSSTSEPNTLVIARLHDQTCDILDEILLDIVSDLSKENNERHKKRLKHSNLKKKRLHHHHHSHKSKRHKSKGDELESQRTFLQVGSWVYPLIPDVSPCIMSELGAFILPDITADVEGAAVGIIVPEDKHEQVHEMFTNILNEFQLAEPSGRGRPRRSVAAGYSSKFVRGATYLANNLVRGAGSTARFLDTSAPKIIDKISPQTQAKEISPRIQKTVDVAKTVSGKAVNVTDYLATKIGLATSALGRYLSPYIHEQGSKLLTSATNMKKEEATQKIDSVLNAASNAVHGISIIYGGLEEAARILAQSLSNNTVQIVEYKYGQEAGALTRNTLATVGNIYHTHHNIRVLKPKGFTKAAIRGAGNAILEDFRDSRSHLQAHEEFKGPGPGAGEGFLPNA